MSVRSEFFSALWAMSPLQNSLVIVSAVLSIFVFFFALMRVFLMDKKVVASAEVLPFDEGRETNHV